ncbi:hypothetical protein CSUI_006589, partial [Cystoisospora suis]
MQAEGTGSAKVLEVPRSSSKLAISCNFRGRLWLRRVLLPAAERNRLPGRGVPVPVAPDVCCSNYRLAGGMGVHRAARSQEHAIRGVTAVACAVQVGVATLAAVVSRTWVSATE